MDELTETILTFIKLHKSYFDVAQALSSVINLLGWFLGACLVTYAWRTNAIKTVNVGPIAFQLQAAVEATAAAARGWAPIGAAAPVDMGKVRESVSRAFTPKTADNLIGKSILWVDDNPANNELAVRALRSLQLEVDQQPSTQAGLEAMKRRQFHLVISDMGRGTNMRAGYELLDAIRAQGNAVPFFIFAGDDKPEFRAEAKARGAQLSTNNILELTDAIISTLGTSN